MPTYSLYFIHSDFWHEETAVSSTSSLRMLRQLICEAVALRRRIEKGANLEAERTRYGACLIELECKLGELGVATALSDVSSLASILQQGEIPFVSLPSRYFDLLVRAHLMEEQKKFSELAGGVGLLQSSRNSLTAWGSSVFPPLSLAGHISQLETLSDVDHVKADSNLSAVAEHRIQLFRAIRDLNAGAIEVAEELDNTDIPLPVARSTPPPFSVAQEPPSDIDRSWINAKGRKRMHDRFVTVITAALPVMGKVNMSDQSHEISTEVLGGFVRKHDSQEPGKVRVIYADGSEASPFPLRILPARPAPEAENPVRIQLAMMSMRHLELDPLVDWAWYRNKEVSQTRPLAESDDYCFQYSLKQLSELLAVYDDRCLTLDMYHTGFEPAVIGFYRAAVVTLLGNPGRFCVTPHYYRGGSRFSSSRTVWS